MADAPDLGSGVLDVGVQVPLSAPVDIKKEMLQAFPFLFVQNVDISPFLVAGKLCCHKF